MSTRPSLALIPSAYKVNKVYSVLPENGDGDFDFTRNSTATRVNKEGLIEEVAFNIPRLDYSDGGCPSLLLEPQRSNLITYSEAFDNSYWTKNGSSVTSGFISPEGTANSFKLVENTSTGDHRIDAQGISTSSGSKYTLSMFLKKDGRSWFKLRDFITNAYINVNLSNGTIGSTNLANNTQKIESFGNDWYKVSFTFTASSSVALRLYIAESNNSTNYTGDGTSGIYIWGAQLEEGYPTSYIPTQGSQVTRVAETCSQTPPSGIIGQTEGTMYVDVDINTLSTDGQVLRLTNGTSGFGRIVIERNPSNQNQIRVTQWGGSVLTFSISIGNRYKIAVGYDSSNSNVYVNGSSIGTSSFNNVAELNKVSLGCNEVGGSIFNDTIKETKLYNTRLSNAELQQLTTL